MNMLFGMVLPFLYEFLYLISIFRFRIHNRKTSGISYVKIIIQYNLYFMITFIMKYEFFSVTWISIPFHYCLFAYFDELDDPGKLPFSENYQSFYFHLFIG